MQISNVLWLHTNLLFGYFLSKPVTEKRNLTDMGDKIPLSLQIGKDSDGNVTSRSVSDDVPPPPPVRYLALHSRSWTYFVAIISK